jgi:hypothetical protein
MADDELTRRIADRQRMARIAELHAELETLTPNTPYRLAEHLSEAYREIDRLRQRLADAGIDDA